VESKGVVIPKGYPPGTIAYDQKPELKKVLAGLPEFAFGLFFTIKWLSPDGFVGSTMRLAFQAMAIEMLLVHANTMFGWRAMASDRRKQSGLIALLGAFYVAFGGALSLAFKSLAPFAIIIGFSITRAWSSMVDPPPDEFAQRYWFNMTGLNIGWYSFIALVTVFVPLPLVGGMPLGISEPMLWFDGWDWEEHRLIFMAGAFYLLRGFATMWPWPRRLYLTPAPEEMRG
jgi:hypothetical protein